MPEHNAQPETMVRINFDPVQKRETFIARLVKLRLLIPELQEEKARIEGALGMLNEINPPQQMTGPVPAPGGGDGEPEA